MPSARVLLVDFNNFSRYPTLAIGYLAAILRGAGHEVRVFSPLAVGIQGVAREPTETLLDLVSSQLRYQSSTLETPLIRRVRAKLSFLAASPLARSKNRVADAFERELAKGTDIVLVSTYLMYRPHCEKLAHICARQGVPMLLGSQSFSIRRVVDEWRNVEGVTALVGGEVEPMLPELVEATVRGEELLRFPGVWTRSGGTPAPPLQDLDSVPFPDFDDFPWDAYPNRIVPIISGRGCGWGKCSFCSDILMGAGRGYRSRSPENVLAEATHQSQRYASTHFVFTDLKLNSNQPVWEALGEQLQSRVENARWIGAVHVDPRDSTLERAQLEKASRAGCVRLTTGLESGSQRVLDAFKKGTDLSRTSRFLHDARAAEISVRTTMIVGAPGETAADLGETRRFLAQHHDCIERVRLNRLSIMTGTGLYNALQKHPEEHPSIDRVVDHAQQGVALHINRQNRDKAYRRAMRELITTVHEINRAALNDRARAFDGVM